MSNSNVGIPAGSFLRLGMARIHNFQGRYKVYYAGTERGVYDSLQSAKDHVVKQYRLKGAWVTRTE